MKTEVTDEMVGAAVRAFRVPDHMANLARRTGKTAAAMRLALEAAIAAQPKSEVVQSVEAKDAALAIEWANIHEAESGRYLVNQRFTNARRHLEISQFLRKAALAHPRPTSGSGSYADDETFPSNDRAMLLYLMRSFDSESFQCRDCGRDEDTASMDSAIALREYLRDRAGPAGEQSAEVWESAHGYQEAFYKIAEILDIGAMPESPSKVFASVMLPMIRELVAAQPLPAGVPDGWEIEDAGGGYVRITSPRATDLCIGFLPPASTEATVMLRDLACALLAAAPAPGKGGEA